MTTTLFAAPATQDNLGLEVIEARVALLAGEVAKAREMTEQLMAKYPKNAELHELMSQIIDREIAGDKEPKTKKAPEEFPKGEARIEMERWMERAKTLASYHQYDQAILAAEKVFQFDPQNVPASRFIDEIQAKALKEGEKDLKTLANSSKLEGQDRVTRYLSQAREWMRTGRIGAARLACDKILILNPTQEEALALKAQIRKRLENETGKTF